MAVSHHKYPISCLYSIQFCGAGTLKILQISFRLRRNSAYSPFQTSRSSQVPTCRPSQSGCTSTTPSIGHMIQGLGKGQSSKWMIFACAASVRASHCVKLEGPPKVPMYSSCFLRRNSEVCKTYGRCGRTSAEELKRLSRRSSS